MLLEDVAKTLTIMIVEDDEGNQQYIKEIFVRKKFNVILTDGGADTVDLVKAHDPDVILMDIQLVDISGIDLIKEIKSHKNLRNIPIIAVTAFAMQNDRERIINQSSCDDYISKPFLSKDILALVKKHVPALRNVN